MGVHDLTNARFENGLQSSNDTMSEWDRFSIALFILIILSIGIFYWIFFGDLYIPLLCIIALVALYHYYKGESLNLYRPLGTMRFPFREGLIILIIFLYWGLILHPIIGPSLPLKILGSIFFGFIIPFAFLFLYIGYPRERLGLQGMKADEWRSVLLLCVLILIPSLLLIFSPTSSATNLSSLLSFLGQIIYLGFTVGFVEEFIFRAVLQNRVAYLSRSRVLGILVTSSLFAALHMFSVLSLAEIPQATVVSAILYAILTRLPLGIIISVVWNETESLYGVSLIHATNNIAVLVRILLG